MTIDKERLRVLAEAATPGPWVVGPAHTDDEGYVELPIGSVVNGKPVTPAVVVLQFPYVSGMQEANAGFIAAAREAIPTLLSENAALAAEVERTTNNRDMWKAQCAAQAKELERLRKDHMTAVNQRDELRHMIDRRPAINAGLISAYIEWSGGLYALDWLNAKDAMADKGGAPS